LGVRVGWPGVLAAALVGAILGALLTWATLTGIGAVRGARPTPPARSGDGLVQPTATAATPAPTRRTTNAAPGRAASPGELQATYDFDVDLDYAAGSATVTERLRVRNQGRATDALELFVLPHLDADGAREFELGSLEVDGRRPPLRWTQSGANLTVGLVSPLRYGATTELVIEFVLRAGADVDTAQAAAVSKADGIMQLLLWYPILSDGRGVAAYGDPLGAVPPSDVRYTIRSVAPIDFAVPGVVSSEGTREVSGRLDRARDFAFAAGPHLSRWTGRSGATRVEVYSRPGADGALARDLSILALDRIGRLLGAAYPTSRYVVVGGTMDMESSGIVFLHRDALASEYRVAHETAHQWFPWQVGSDQQREPWLDEALATYLATDLHAPHVPWCSDVPVDWPVDRFPSQPIEAAASPCNGYLDTIYLKGAAMFAAIDRTMGHRAFVAALRDYVATFRWRIATGDDLLAMLRKHAPGVLDRVLDGWLRQPSMPGWQPDRGLGPLA